MGTEHFSELDVDACDCVLFCFLCAFFVLTVRICGSALRTHNPLGNTEREESYFAWFFAFLHHGQIDFFRGMEMNAGKNCKKTC